MILAEHSIIKIINFYKCFSVRLGRYYEAKAKYKSSAKLSISIRLLKCLNGLQVVEAREGRAIAEAQAAQSASQVALWEGQLAKARRQLAITEDKLKVGCH